MMQSSRPSFASDVSQARVLIVDDSALMRDLLYTCLKAFDVPKVIAVETPDECLQEFRDRPFDAAIIDWRLKDHDGLALIRQIRKDLPDPLCQIPIVLCTGYSEVSRVIEARDAGINEMLCKPVTPRSLYSKLTSALSNDRKFMVTEDYIGPERRAHQRPPVRSTGNGEPKPRDIFV